MIPKLSKTTIYTALIVVIAAMVAAGGFWAYSRAAGDTITVCVQKDGLMHVVGGGFRRADCRKNESLLTWNIQGPQGPKGDKGDPGVAGASLHLFDGGDQDLGLLLDAADPLKPVRTYHTYLSLRDLLLAFAGNARARTLELITPLNGGVFFEGSDCSGQAFSQNRPDRVAMEWHELVRATGPRYFKAVDETPAAFTGLSYIPETFGAPCTNTSTSTPNGIWLEEISLPFTEPLAWPPDIRLQ